MPSPTTGQVPYTTGKRTAEGIFIREAEGHLIGTCRGTFTLRAEEFGNARLSVASDNAVIALAEHLNMGAVELAERLAADDGLVRLVKAANLALVQLAFFAENLKGEKREAADDAAHMLRDDLAALALLSPDKTEGAA